MLLRVNKTVETEAICNKIEGGSQDNLNNNNNNQDGIQGRDKLRDPLEEEQGVTVLEVSQDHVALLVLLVQRVRTVI